MLNSRDHTADAPPKTATRSRRLSKPGLIFAVVGGAMIAVELLIYPVRGRLGSLGHWAILVCGGYFLFWGATETIAGFSPRLGSGGLTRHRFFLPLEGRVFLLVMVAVFIGSLLGRSNPLLLVFCCLVGPFVVNGVVIVTMLQRLTITRTLPPRVMVGECFSVEMGLSNSKRVFPVWMMSVIDRIHFVGGRLDPTVLFVHVPRRGRQSGSYRASAPRRGRLTFGPVIVQSRFPLGVVERGLQSQLPGELLVYPRLGRLSSGWRRLVNATHEASLAAAHVAQSSDSFHRLRDYHSGDDRRTIHWRTSARRNELIVREFRDERDSPIVLLVDAWRPHVPDPRHTELLELAISFAATVCVQQRRSARDAPVACAASGDRLMEWNGGFRGAATEQLLDSLAILEATPAADWKALLAFAARNFDRKQTTVLITQRADALRAELPGVLAEIGFDHSGAILRIMEAGEIETSRAFSWA